ncbi:DUF3515 family protein [Galbitalea sp. SE-J8]|uniref:DUF3515 family protein n=1 Tax=Galbitalea sp. SE-J8 TaxID=3054952 RepID=UPI00259C6C7E|nr:DUF3515 family protein [Galbitalea sp. SE-J8]MDM4762983.1 DUF3515 family protein [Galbitalea sp. SE-J8]
MLRPLAAVAAALLVASALAGCSAPVALDAAPDAKNPACAAVSVAVRDTAIGDLAERDTTAQATAAWGDPAAVTLRCGVEVPAPSTLPCYELNGIYWLLDDSAAPVYRYTTFGRDPAVQVVVDQDRASTYTSLDTLSDAVGSTPATGAVCSDAIDPTEGSGDATSTPSG